MVYAGTVDSYESGQSTRHTYVSWSFFSILFEYRIMGMESNNDRPHIHIITNPAFVGWRCLCDMTGLQTAIYRSKLKQLKVKALENIVRLNVIQKILHNTSPKIQCFIMSVVTTMPICSINIKSDNANVKIYIFVTVFILREFRITEMTKTFPNRPHTPIRIDIVKNTKFVSEFSELVIFDAFMIQY